MVLLSMFDHSLISLERNDNLYSESYCYMNCGLSKALIPWHLRLMCIGICIGLNTILAHQYKTCVQKSRLHNFNALIIKNPNLQLKFIKYGKLNPIPCAIAYIVSNVFCGSRPVFHIAWVSVTAVIFYNNIVTRHRMSCIIWVCHSRFDICKGM